MNQLSGVSRRNLAIGAAWSVPVLMASSAAPAYAASDCLGAGIYSQAQWVPVTGTVMTPVTPGNMVYKTNETGVAQAMLTTISSALIGGSTKIGSDGGNMSSSRVDNLFTPVATSTAGFGGIYVNTPFLYIGQAFKDTFTGGAYQTITFTFSQAVSCLSFWIVDIDTNWTTSDSRHADYLEVSSPTASFAVSGGSATTNLTFTNSPGVGQPAKVTETVIPTGRNSTYEWLPSSGRGNACFSTSGPVTTFTIKYGSTNSTTNIWNAQQVYMSPITYRSSPLPAGCTCPSCVTVRMP